MCVLYIFFYFFRRRRSLRECVCVFMCARVRAHANRAVEMTQELIAFRRYMVPQGVVMCICGLQIAVWAEQRGGQRVVECAREERKKITAEPSSRMNATAYDIIYFAARRKPEAVVPPPPPPQTTRKIPVVEHIYNISFRTLNTDRSFFLYQ